ncbi:hypothetical protein ACFQBY_01145 [Promicromonospora citrea]|uniref:Uncharacterized protein n=1 Tax=Promicromonospora citrea TaxID=43677 RepID=A0A8H9GPE2_9MICO|nr:hypothetical protein [Promicromonospora citrea]NNH54278.1 hypothetical protein [Promicromonospora citrea]GGM43038.1 hypothetical protein GCM10010102_43220 [Promicromonospora citrea]
MDDSYETEVPGPEEQPGTDDAVRRALDGLDGLADLPTAEHVGRFEAVHDALRVHLSGDA